MSGAIIYTPATGADWATAWEQTEYTRKGKVGLSLTNYDNTSLPAIASGSWAECAGSIYKWTGEEAVSGSLTGSAINYIKLVPSGSGDTAIVTATWTASEPTWSDAYQGWYSGTSRYIAAEYYDGSNHYLKVVLFNQHCGFHERYHNPDGWVQVVAASTNTYWGTDLPLGIVTAFGYYVNPAGGCGGSGWVRLRRYERNTATFLTMADVGTTEGETTTISYSAIVDKSTYGYYVDLYNQNAAIENYYVYIKIKEWIRA